jgi:outer membrane biosynthesis protein TonB
LSNTSAAAAVYKRKPFSNFDPQLALIFLLVALMESVLIFWGNSQVLPEMSAEEVKEFFAKRYNRIEEIRDMHEEIIQPVAPEMLTTPSDVAEEVAPLEPAQEQLEQPVERQKGTAEMRAERRAKADAKRADRRAAVDQGVINSTGGLALVTGTGESAAGDLVDAARVSSSSAVSTEGLAGMVTGGAAENVRRLRTDAPSGGGSGGVDLQAAMASVEVGVEGGTVGGLLLGDLQSHDRSGRFSAEQSRSAAALKSVISGYTPGLKDCFDQQLRKDSSLSGSLLLTFAITPDGSVTDLAIKDSRWTNERLGRRVESCIKRKVSAWKFDGVDSAKGNFRMGQKLTFGR